MLLSLLHLCDTLFPIGAFSYSDGLEAATSVRRPDSAEVSKDGESFPLRSTGIRGASGAGGRAAAARNGSRSDKPRISNVGDLCGWMDTCLDETLGRLEGPAVWQAWAAVRDEDWNTLIELDQELDALRPASSARRSSRAMGLRLLTMWQTLYPEPGLEHTEVLARTGRLGPGLPIAFACACAAAGVERRQAVEAFAYTRLAATVSAAMRLMPIGQTEAHRLLARTLDRVAPVVDGIIERDARIESFSPALDIALMTQQYLHSRLFRS